MGSDGPIPDWAISTWIYGDYPGVVSDTNAGLYTENTWFNTVNSNISAYNTSTKYINSQINQIYAYASDAELPWSSLTTSAMSAASWHDYSQYSFSFATLSDSTPVLPDTLNCKSAIAGTNNPQAAIIVDGRIDNGYLQGFNEIITTADAKCLADIIVEGANAACCTGTNTTCKSTTGTCFVGATWPCKSVTGIGAFGPTNGSYSDNIIYGVQIDFEPFNSAVLNQQTFYNELGSKLAYYGQWFSLFVYPKAFNQATADLLNGTQNGQLPSGQTTSRNNGYNIVALYDLVDMKDGINPICDADYTKTDGVCDVSGTPAPVIANGDATSAIYDPTVPHSLEGYYNAALLAVKQTIQLASLYKIRYKFGIPVSSSVHEFENWGIYSCKFDQAGAGKPNNAFCSSYNTIPMNPESGSPSQLEYVQQAIRAIQDGISQMGSTFDSQYFRGIDFYSFGFKTIWTPQNPIKDVNVNNIYYGNTPVFVPGSSDGTEYLPEQLNVPYIYTTPSYPVFGSITTGGSQGPDLNTVLGWLSTQVLDPRPCSTTTCPSTLGSCQSVDGSAIEVCVKNG
jgi:hypothetical protein